MKTKQKNWKQRLISVLICLVVGWLVYTAAMNLIAWHFAKQWSSTHQNLDVVPTPLTDTSMEGLTGHRIEKFGFSFQVPWKDVEHDQTTKSIALMSFKEGGGVLIFDPASQPDGAKIMRGTTARQQGLMNEVLGLRALSSNYELMVSEVQTTPSEVKWWATREHNVRNLILLANKTMNLGSANVIHSIGSTAVRGFQYGDPNVSPYLVQLDLFDGADSHYKIIVTGKRQNRPVISQAQINALIASFRARPSGMARPSPSSGN